MYDIDYLLEEIAGAQETALLEEAIADGLVHNERYTGSLPALMGKAAECGNVKVIELLVAAGVNVDAHNAWKNAAIHSAHDTQSIAVLETLVKHGADLNKKGSGQYTALHYCCINGWLEGLNFLIAHGADLSVLDEHQHTPLMLAAYNTHLTNYQMVDALLKAGARIEMQTTFGAGAALCAIQKDNVESLRVMLEHGLPDDEDHAFLLHYAAKFGAYRSIELLSACWQDVSTPDWEGVTALHIACAASPHASAESTIRTLILLGADIHLKNNAGLTPLDVLKGNGMLANFEPSFHQHVRERAAIAAAESFDTASAVRRKSRHI